MFFCLRTKVSIISVSNVSGKDYLFSSFPDSNELNDNLEENGYADDADRADERGVRFSFADRWFPSMCK